MFQKALIIGIDYVGQSQALRGCVADAKLMIERLKKHMGFKEVDIIALLDDPSCTRKPTKANIIQALYEVRMMSQRVPLQPLWLSYSGHGSYVLDTNQDEVDGKDETWVPLDFATAGVIRDDELRVLLQGIHSATTVIGLSDSCHSGTIFDLPFVAKPDGNNSTLRMQQVAPPWSTTQARILLLSACRDQETATETVVADDGVRMEIHGLLSYHFWKVLEAHQFHIRCDTLLLELQKRLLDHGYTQIPQLSSTDVILETFFCMNRLTRPFLQTV